MFPSILDRRLYPKRESEVRDGAEEGAAGSPPGLGEQMELSPPCTEDWGSEPEPHGDGRALGGGRQSRTLLTSSALAPACAGQGLSLWGQAALHKCLLAGSGRGGGKEDPVPKLEVSWKMEVCPQAAGD